jgi:hypothetical protein
MTNAEAKRILIACRPAPEDISDPEMAAALREVERDPELRQWWEQQREFHGAAQESFRTIPVPRTLRDRIAARTKIIRIPFWRRPAVLAAAAAIVVLFGVTAVLWPGSSEDSFQTFRSRMVGTVLRQYSMVEMTNMAQIRQYLATNNAPADYVLPPKLAQLPASGAGVLSWQSDRAAMVCLDSGTQGTLFLFIVDESKLKHPPGNTAAFAQVNKLATASWSQGGKTYVLAGHGDSAWLRQYL